MVQIINRPSGLGELGSALGTGLHGLAQHKIDQLLQQKQQSRQSKGLSQLLGIPEHEASFISSLDPKIQQTVISQKLQEPSQQSFARGIEALLGGSEQSQDINSQQVDTNGQPMEGQEAQQRKSVLSQGAKLTEKQASTLGKLALQQQSLERKEELKEQQTLRQESRAYLDELQNKSELAKFSNTRLNKMENLVNKGSLPISAFYKTLKNLEEHVNPAYAAGAGATAGGIVGGPVGAAIGGALGGIISPIATILRSVQRGVTSTDTEEFEKLSADFIKDAKGIFGSRLTDADLRAFLETIPTLSHTDAGKIKIIKNLKAFNEVAEVKYKAAKRIIKENKGIIPPNLKSLVEESTSEDLRKWSEEFSAV